MTGTKVTNTSRRRFLKTTAGVSVAGAATATAAALGAVPVTTRMARPVHYAMVIDTRRCSGCHACSVACKSEFDIAIGNTRSWVEYVEKGDFPDVARNFLPRLCNHCSNPQCVNVCPTGATYKREEDGIVVVDSDICICCKYCIQACPYDVRFLNQETGTVEKCDFCLHRIKEGVVPACVNTCQGKARIFGDMNDPKSDVAMVLASNPVTVLRQGMGTEPNVYYIGADHSDGRDSRFANHYIRIDTHRRAQERR